MRRLIVLPLILLLLSGCGRDISGTYLGSGNGTQNGTPYTSQITLIIVQNDDSFAGTWKTSLGDSGSTSGKIDGESIKDFIILSGVCGSYTGTGLVSGKTLSAAVSGSANSNCATFSMTLSLKKQ